MISFDKTVRQMTEMSQQKNDLYVSAKKNRIRQKCLIEKNRRQKCHSEKKQDKKTGQKTG